MHAEEDPSDTIESHHIEMRASDSTVGVYLLVQTFSKAAYFDLDVCHREVPKVQSLGNEWCTLTVEPLVRKSVPPNVGGINASSHSNNRALGRGSN